jgi:hypothetical protein
MEIITCDILCFFSCTYLELIQRYLACVYVVQHKDDVTAFLYLNTRFLRFVGITLMLVR